jgi:DNA-directed RNA polymerase specialized sigma24 family protein
MADVAMKRVAQRGPMIREQLKAMDDADVVTSFLEGEERAFQELVERYQTRLLNFIYRTIGDREKAEDLVQEVFIRVYRHLHRFDRSKKFSTWAYTIASNLAKNELRNRTGQTYVDLFLDWHRIYGDETDPDRVAKCAPEGDLASRACCEHRTRSSCIPSWRGRKERPAATL